MNKSKVITATIMWTCGMALMLVLGEYEAGSIWMVGAIIIMRIPMRRELP